MYQKGNFIRFKSDKTEYTGKIKRSSGDSIVAEAITDKGRIRFEITTEDIIECISPVTVDMDMMRRLLRYEAKISSIIKTAISVENVIFPWDNYEVTLDDLKAAFENYVKSGDDEKTFFDEWVYFLVDVCNDEHIFFPYDDDILDRRYLFPTPEYLFADIVRDIECVYDDEEYITTDEAREYVNDINCVQKYCQVPVQDIVFTDNLASRYIDGFYELLYEAQYGCERRYTVEEYDKFRELAELLCDKNDADAHKIMGNCYRNNLHGFENDIEKAVYHYEKYIDLSEFNNPIVEHIEKELGMLYRYSVDTPDHNKKAAFYFMLADSDNFICTKNELAKMYMEGIGVPKDKYLADKIRYDAFYENICGGFLYLDEMDYLAKIAYHIACEHEHTDIGKCRFLLAAKYIRYRDNELTESINRELEKLNIVPKEVCENAKVLLYEDIINLNRNCCFQMKIRYRDGEPVLVISKKDGNLFVSSPCSGIVGRYSSFNLKMKNISDFYVFTESEVTEFDSAEYKSNCIYLKRYDKTVARIQADFAYLPEEHIKDRFASVRFAGGTTEYTYICDFDVRVGQKVLVKNANGLLNTVTVTKVFEADINDLPLPKERYKKIEGIAD